MLALLAVALCPAPAIAPQDVRPAAARVQGIALDARGDPLPAAEVWLAPADDSRQVLARGSTDGQGLFVLPAPALENLRVHARAPGKVQVHGWADPALDGAAALHTLRLWDAVTVRGRVVDLAGRPVADAAVVAAPVRRIGLLIDPIETRTGPDGRYELRDAPMGEVLLSAWSHHHAPVTRQAMFRHGKEQDLAFGEKPPRSLRIAVKGLPEGVSAEGWRVEMRRLGLERLMPRAYRVGILGEGGEREFTGLPSLESMRIRVADPSGRYDCDEARWSYQDPSDRLELQASPTRSLEWQVTLVGPDGGPLRDQRLLLSVGGTSAVVTTGEDGTASIRARCGANRLCTAVLVGAGEWVLDEDGGRYTADRPEPATLKAVPAASVRGTLLGAEGKILSGSRLVLEDWDGNRLPRWSPLAYARSDGQGRFAITGLWPLQRPLRLRVPRTRTLLPIDGKLASGECLELDTVIARPAGTIEGRVVDASGAPLPGARVFLIQIRVPGLEQVELLTDADGRFRLSPAAAGRWAPKLYWAENRGSLKSVGDTFEVLDGRTATVELESSRR